MICRTCSAAAEVEAARPHFGNTLIALKDHGSHFNASTSDVLLKVGRLMHTLCRGSTHCDCQHKDVGTAVAYDELREINDMIREGLENAERSNVESTAETAGQTISGDSEAEWTKLRGIQDDFGG